ncbi:hypothetical protein D9M68_799910 [compost metagenome]
MVRTEIAPSALMRSITWRTRISGAEAPAVRPTRARPSNHSACNSSALSTMWAGVPSLSATSRRRLLLELVGLPTTITTSTCGLSSLTASCRFCVA